MLWKDCLSKMRFHQIHSNNISLLVQLKFFSERKIKSSQEEDALDRGKASLYYIQDSRCLYFKKLPSFIGVNLKSGHNDRNFPLLAVFLYWPSDRVRSY